jgi:hypothetical protein
VRVVREALGETETSMYPTIYGRLKSSKKYAIRLEDNEVIVYLGDDSELEEDERRELEFVTDILEGIE